MDIDFGGPPEYYCDSVQVTANAWSVIFNLGLGTDRPKEQKTFAVVRMSPQHAKALHGLLGNTINAYERELGEIPMPQLPHLDGGLDEGADDGD
ncbi:MAG: hypothetical protein R2720_03400 [Candidatus Nanopelagicales bacterium]